MTPKRFKLLVFTASCFLVGLTILSQRKARAMEFQEVKPYVFADLPHGTIYKTVHEGCELYIVETNNDAMNSGGRGYIYSVTAGRGCK